MRERDARARFAGARVATLGTVTADGLPHLVPVVFAVAGETVFTAVDAKPKSTRALRRLDNIRARGRASMLVDGYDEDWTRLWWVRVDGPAEVVAADSASGVAGIAALGRKYPQYVAAAPAGPVIAVRMSRWVSWFADEPESGRAG